MATSQYWNNVSDEYLDVLVETMKNNMESDLPVSINKDGKIQVVSSKLSLIIDPYSNALSTISMIDGSLDFTDPEQFFTDVINLSKESSELEDAWIAFNEAQDQINPDDFIKDKE